MVSVIIPVYNTAAYLERAVNSVLDNTYQNIEVLCINDGSTDNSLEVLNMLAEKDARVRVISQDNGGVSYARNHGLKQAKGEYICFLDSDDWIHRQFFEVLLNAGDADICIGDYLENHDDNTDIKNIPVENVAHYSQSLEDAVQTGYIRNTIWGRVFKRDCIDNCEFPLNIKMAEDQIFNTLLYSRAEAPSIMRVNIPLYFYYCRGDSAVHSYAEDAYLMVCNWYVDHFDLFERKAYVIEQAFRSAFTYRYEGSFGNNKSDIRKKSKIALRRCISFLVKEPGISQKEKLKFLVAAASPAMYRMNLIRRDKTVLIWEGILKERARKEREGKHDT